MVAKRLTEAEREDLFNGLGEVDALQMVAHVMTQFPAVFDSAADNLTRIRAHLAEIHAKETR